MDGVGRACRPPGRAGPVAPQLGGGRASLRRLRWPHARVGLVLVLAGLVVACSSTPMRAWHGARHYAAGSEALEQGDAPRAIHELERAAELVPHASEVQNHLGLAYWASGETDRAQLAFERALELDCDNRAARGNLDRLEARGAYPGVGGSQHGG